MDASGYKKIQTFALAIALVLLVVFDFAGAYYGSSSTYRSGSRYDVSTDRYDPVYRTTYDSEFEFVRLGSGPVNTVMILLGIGALLYGLKNAIKGDVKKANKGAKFAVGLAVVGAVMFVITYGDATDWWFDAGFYGTFFGGLVAVYAGNRAVALGE
jgi:hypothetical protein